jgi:hypothetical protein
VCPRVDTGGDDAARCRVCKADGQGQGASGAHPGLPAHGRHPRRRHCRAWRSHDPVGNAIGFVTLGGERVEETAELFTFYGPGGGGYVFADGHTPVSLEILSTERLVKPGDSGGSGPEMSFNVPLVASLPGAPYASIRSIDLQAGSAYRSHGHTIYYARLPHTCPRGGWLAREEVIFAEDGEPSRPETVEASEKVPCPSEAAAAHRSHGSRR